MREERYYVLVVVVVLGLGAAAPRTAQQPPAVPVRVLQGRFEGIPAQQRGKGVVVEAKAARHATYVASWGCPNARAAPLPVEGQ